MLIDVGDQVRTLWLNVCFFAILMFTIAAIIPWGGLGLNRVSRLSRWFFLPVLSLAVVYEAIMPTRFNIRIDLFLLLPMYTVVLITSVFRWWRSRAT